jgi:hypothetical protein
VTISILLLIQAGATALMLACSGGGHTEIVQLLLDAKADVDTKDKVSRTTHECSGSACEREILIVVVTISISLLV